MESMQKKQEMSPEIGMLVTFISRDHRFVPYGTDGVIDVVDHASRTFWVLTKTGGFFGWTSFKAWEWTGQKLARTAETEDWYSMREEVAARTRAQ